MTSDKGACAVCGGFFFIHRTYEGLDKATITEWICDSCGRVVKIASNSDSAQVGGDNPHIDEAAKPTMTGKELLAFADDFMGVLGFVRETVAKSGSENAPNSVIEECD